MYGFITSSTLQYIGFQSRLAIKLSKNDCDSVDT